MPCACLSLLCEKKLIHTGNYTLGTEECVYKMCWASIVLHRAKQRGLRYHLTYGSRTRCAQTNTCCYRTIVFHLTAVRKVGNGVADSLCSVLFARCCGQTQILLMFEWFPCHQLVDWFKATRQLSSKTSSITAYHPHPMSKPVSLMYSIFSKSLTLLWVTLIHEETIVFFLPQPFKNVSISRILIVVNPLQISITLAY